MGMTAERAVRRARALALGRYPSAAAVARTRAEPFSAREAVLTDTPLRRATCLRSTAMVRKRSHTDRLPRYPTSAPTTGALSAVPGALTPGTADKDAI